MNSEFFKKENLNNCLTLLRKFFYSSYYPLLLVIISYTYWATKQSVAGICLLLIIGLISFLVNDDISPSIVMLPIMVMTVAKDDFLDSKSNIALIVVVGVLFFIAVLFNFIHYKHKFRSGKLTLPLIAVSIALIFGGIGSPYMKDYPRGLAYIFYLGVLMLALYSYIISCTKIPDSVNKKKYFAKLILTITVLCCLQVLTRHLTIFIEEGWAIELHFRNMLYVGWSNRAGLAEMMVLTLSIPFYLAEISKKYHFLWYNLGLINYILLVSTGSRAGVLFGTIEMIAIAIYLIKKSDHKKQFLYAILVWLILAIIVIGIKWDFLVQMINNFVDLGLNSSGRTNLYKEAIDVFLHNPLFGVGCGYIGPPENFVVYPGCTYWFHSTPLHILAVTGVFGFVCYGYFYIKKFKIIFKRNDLFNIMLGIGLVAFELYNLIDAATFIPFPFLYTAILLNTMLEITNKDTVDKISE